MLRAENFKTLSFNLLISTYVFISCIISRFLFLPIEDSFYVFFAKMLNRNKTAKEHEKVRIVFKLKCFIFS